jgi:hypothetical protein
MTSGPLFAPSPELVESLQYFGDRDAELRTHFKPPISADAGVALFSHAKALLDAQAEAGHAEKSLCDEIRERLEREAAR